MSVPLVARQHGIRPKKPNEETTIEPWEADDEVRS
jgi:hypothetical protein